MSTKRIPLTKRKRQQFNPNFLSRVKCNIIADAILDVMGPSGFMTNPGRYSTGPRHDYLVDSFWSKYSSPGLSKVTGKEDTSPDERRQKAIEKWLSVERRNAKTNSRLLFSSVNFGFATSEQILTLARKYVEETIGREPPSTSLSGFTGGASTRVKRGPGAIAEKFEGKAHASLSCTNLWIEHVARFEGWTNLNPEFRELVHQESSVLFTVPKTSEIDRVACKEPEINMYLQRGYGNFIRKRMKRFGIDLNDQSRNQSLAREGSTSRKLATLDLSSASDTVSRVIVARLLPPAWYRALDAVRVKSTIMPEGDCHYLEMFSSMGNGFTFELESLIFWALTRSVASLSRTRGKIGIFGDDIVCPTDVAGYLTRVLPFFGFKLNEKKSFRSGPFRESCGGHYYNGLDVTPFYFREEIRTVTDLIHIGNALLWWLYKAEMPGTEFQHEWLFSLWSKIKSLVPSNLHGGQSFERTDALVTGDSPRKRLVQLHEPIEIPQVGGLLEWLHGKEVSPFMVTSPTEAASQGRWVLRPNRSEYRGEIMCSSKIAWARYMSDRVVTARSPS